MQRVERHIIKKYKNLDNVLFLSKNLYNQTNYIIRQVFTKHPEKIEEYKDLINERNFISEYDLSQRFSKLNQIDYRSLPIQTSQQIIKLVFKNWKSYFSAVKDYNKNKSKYLGHPKIPKYKDKKNGKNILIFTNQNCKLKDNFIYFPKQTNIKPIKTKVNNFCQVRIVPKCSCYVLEIIYEKEKKINENLNSESYIGIDLGVNNICSIASNQLNISPVLVNGRIIKSINQYYNKIKAKLQSKLPDKNNKHGKKSSRRIRQLTFKRNNRINGQLHKISRFIINFCIENQVKNIVIGKNVEWKQESEMSKKNNQNFILIPHDKLIEMIKYKAEEVGIEVILIEESYTSKCDALAFEKLEHQDKYLGRRIKRGFFRSSTDKYINADTNGSLNILRKAIGDDFLKDLINSGYGFTPRKVKIF